VSVRAIPGELPPHTAGGGQGLGRPIVLGLAANRRQFTLLVGVNALVGAMVGLERATLPLVAGADFRVASATLVLTFVATFGLAKALANLAAGSLAVRRSRRSTLLAGWVLALPVPLMIGWAPSWSWIVAANALLGVSQGLAWSMTVIMKIDLVGPRRRGLAMGLNEFAGYLAVALAALASGAAAARWGLRAGPAYLGVGIATVGLLVTALWVRDTSAHARLEETTRGGDPGGVSLARVLRRSLWADRRLFSVSQAGFANNLNDGLAWGLFPLFFAGAGLPLGDVALLVAVYPAVWGLGQLATGALSDRWGRKWPIVVGMTVQGGALLAIALTRSMGAWFAELALLGVGTALVYPALLAAVGDIARPSWRSAAIGVYRLWRDLGYVAGALLAGVLADALGMAAAVGWVGAITVASGAVVLLRFTETRRDEDAGGAVSAVAGEKAPA
jgi:MFS family permease